MSEKRRDDATAARRGALGGLLLAALALLLAAPGRTAAADASQERVPVRIGWQVASATQGQLVQVLKRTDVLELHGIEPRLVPFSFGTPEIEAALRGELDVLFAGDQPVVDLILEGGQWTIVSRLYYDRVALMVPPASPVDSVAALQGRKVASPFGSVAHRELIFAEQAAGLDPLEAVENQNLDILEIRRLVEAGGLETWGAYGAVAVWEPTASELELEGHARTLSSSRALGVVAFSDTFVAEHPDAAVQVLAAILRAWRYFSGHADRVRRWYLDEVQLGYSPEALESAAKLDPNYTADSLEAVDLRLTKAHLAGLSQAAAWAEALGHARGDFTVGEAVRSDLLEEAEALAAAEDLEPIEVVVPSAREAAGTHPPSTYFFDRFPLWLLFAFMSLVSFLGIETGELLGRWRRRKGEEEAAGPVGTAVGAVLALLAFVIALTFAAASARFDARKEALLDEVNAIGTAYLRADLLPEPQRTTTRLLLRDWVEIRLGMYRAYERPDQLRTLQARTAAIQESIWSRAKVLAAQAPASEVYSLFIASLNLVFDLNTTRVVLGAEYRMPLYVWWALILVSILAMVAVGFHFGLGGRRSLTASITLSLTFALVVLLVFDLDRPGEGLIDVSQRPMIDLYESLQRQQ